MPWHSKNREEAEKKWRAFVRNTHTQKTNDNVSFRAFFVLGPRVFVFLDAFSPLLCVRSHHHRFLLSFFLSLFFSLLHATLYSDQNKRKEKKHSFANVGVVSSGLKCLSLALCSKIVLLLRNDTQGNKKKKIQPKFFSLLLFVCCALLQFFVFFVSSSAKENFPFFFTHT